MFLTAGLLPLKGINTYLTPWSRFLLERLKVSWLIKKFPTPYGD
jgi:hypothetical protein